MYHKDTANIWDERIIKLALALWLLLLSGCTSQPVAAQSKPSARSSHRVEVLQLKQTQIEAIEQRVGTLHARRQVRIYSQEAGRITQLPYYEGDHVKANTLLASLDDELLQAELDKAKASSRQARVALERFQKLLDKQAVSLDEYTRAQTELEVALAEQRLLEIRLSYTRLHAPFAGLITARYVEPGDVVAKHTHLLTLADPSSLITEVQVSELLLPRLHVGDPAKVQIDALQQEFSGSILRIYPEISPLTRQGTIEIVLDPVPTGARAGQFTRVSFPQADRFGLLIPFSALQRDYQQEFIYCFDPEKQQAVYTPVTSGQRIGEQVEIQGEQLEGQWLITRGFLGLYDGKTVVAVDKNQN